MSTGLLKLDPTADDSAEERFDLDYYRSLSVAQRFRMLIERSILLLRLAEEHDADRESPALVKRV